MSEKVFENGPLAKWLSRVGIFGSALYLALLVGLMYRRWNELQALELNAIGDFLAGAFGPLAVFWLVLGYFQQGVELRHSTEALQLQATELKNSVKQQKELVDVTRSQLKAEHDAAREERLRQRIAARPKFTTTKSAGRSSSGLDTTYYMTISNVGNTATDITFTRPPNFRSNTFHDVAHWSRGVERQYHWQYETQFAMEDCEIEISYIDADGWPGSQTICLEAVPNGQTSEVRVTIVLAPDQHGDLPPISKSW